MKRTLLLLGALALVGTLVSLSGCIIETQTITIVVTDYVCTEFEEEHYDENYTDDTVSIDDDFFQELDEILIENDMSKDDVESAEVIGVFYQVNTGPSNPPWDVSGQIWVQVNGAPAKLLARYQTETLSGPMTDPERIETVHIGLAELNDAIEMYLEADSPAQYPDVVFISNRILGDITPSPSEVSPFIMTWFGCLAIRIDFAEEYDTYDMFPG